MIVIIVILVVIILAILIAVSMHYVVTSKKPEDDKVKYVHQVYEVLELCKIESGEGNISNRIDEIIAAIRYGDINSPEASRNVENRIIGKASELLDNLKNKKSAEVNNNLEELSQLVNERNVISKNNK